jgi:Transposase DDE domain group 1
LNLHPLKGRQGVATFDGGAITSDAGVLLLGQTNERSGWANAAIRLSNASRPALPMAVWPELVEHSIETMVLQRVFGIALGYEDPIDHDELRSKMGPQTPLARAAPSLAKAPRVTRVPSVDSVDDLGSAPCFAAPPALRNRFGLHKRLRTPSVKNHTRYLEFGH